MGRNSNLSPADYDFCHQINAQRGGWSKVATMLDRYAHAIPANDRAAADVLGGMIAGER